MYAVHVSEHGWVVDSTDGSTFVQSAEDATQFDSIEDAFEAIQNLDESIHHDWETFRIVRI